MHTFPVRRAGFFDGTALGLVEPGTVKVGITLVVTGVVVLATAGDPGRPIEVLAALLSGLVLVGWSWWPVVPTPVLAVGVLVPAVLAARSGHEEPTLFLVSLLAVLVAWLEPVTVRAAAVVVLAMAAPVAVALLLPPHEGFGLGNWLLGIALPGLLGRLVRRQLELVARLEAAQGALAAQVLTDERRRIARDVHDLVGHGLAAVLLQITSARHVLRRDPDGADDALAAAETAGRRSMAELRATMALLRSDEDTAPAPPAPGLGGVDDLVRDARAGGLDVHYRSEGDLGGVEDGVALAAHRILQESLANAHRHAPDARTDVRVTVDDQAVLLDVVSVGAVAPAVVDDRPRYGLVGMRERAELVGGTLSAGLDDEGWRVRGRLPVRRLA